MPQRCETEEVWLPIWPLWGSICVKLSNQFHGWDCVKAWAGFHKQPSDVAVVVIKACEDWLVGSGYGILRVSVGAEWTELEDPTI